MENVATESVVRIYVALPQSAVDVLDGIRGKIPRNEWLYKQIMQSIGRKDLADLHRKRGRPKKTSEILTK